MPDHSTIANLKINNNKKSQKCCTNHNKTIFTIELNALLQGQKKFLMIFQKL